jgi:YfiH family protein
MPSTPPVLIQSDLLTRLGVPHAFSTRAGGVSTGVYGSLNFGSPGDVPPEERDAAANVRANWALLATAIGAGGREIVEVHQVHGADVHVARRGGPAHAGPNDTRADALVTDDPGRLVGVRVADCAPALIASADGRVVAAVHAGWKGVIAGVAPRALSAMAALGAEPAGCVAAVGPCISAGAFEVGPEVAAEFRRVFGARTAHVRDRADGKSHVDLKGAIREQLLGAGLRETAVDVLPHCSVGDAGLFFSHRRDRGRTGRMVGAIGPRGE